MVRIRVNLDIADNCAVCMIETHGWYLEKDVPVCKKCAKRSKPEEIPSKAVWLRELGYDLPVNWRPAVESRLRKRVKLVEDPV